MKKEKIGFIGLGIMGSAMAKNLLAAGHTVSVYNRTRAKTAALEQAGASPASSPREIADSSDIAVIMVTDPAAVNGVLEGPDGYFAGDCAGELLVNCSTVSAEFTRELAARCRAHKVRFVDCPVSGSKMQAEKAQLVMLAGGDKAEVENLRPLLLSMGRAVIYAGEAGRGTELKLCINLIVALLTGALCESTALARAFGLDPLLVFDTLDESAALNCPYFGLKKNNIMSGNYPTAFSLANVLKDVKFMLAEADARGQKLPATEAMRDLMQQSLDDGDGGADLTVIAKTLRGTR